MIQNRFLSALKQTSPSSLSVSSSDESGVTSLRRGLPRKDHSSVCRLRLVADEDGLLDWEEGSIVVPGLSKRRRGGVKSDDGAATVAFSKLAPSMITDMLLKQDQKFTPTRGLLKYRPGSSPIHAPLPTSGKFLLIIHGTFSNGENFLRSLGETDFGADFLRDASRNYKGIYLFNHPTISVSPIVNAIDLRRLVASSNAQFDIVSHSRGGLVTRWWCELFDPQRDRCKNAIMVGSPLAGTGLAAPPNIRKTLKLLTNYGNALNGVVGMSALALPVMGIVNTLLSVITAFTSIGASTPISDGLMAMIPGLFGQSRVGNNPELLRLHELTENYGRYAFVRSNYESENPGWRFWKYFSKGRLADIATDLLFDGENDLVVDTDSMAYLSASAQVGPKRIFDFGTTDEVHHVSYFHHQKTIDFCRKILEL